MSMSITDLANKIREANEAYRTGNPIMSDPEWDDLVDQLAKEDPTHELLDEIGFIASDDDRKEKLPHQMRSMHKCKTPEELWAWIKKHGLEGMQLVLSAKYDGNSLISHESKMLAWTRGDGEYGQRSHDHFKAINDTPLGENIYTYGETIIPRERFEEKYADTEYVNPRNTVGGIMNRPEVTEMTKDVDYIRYGLILDDGEDITTRFSKKSEIFEYLNERQDNNVFFHVIDPSDKTINADYLKKSFELWSQKYEIDGIIVEVNDLKKQNEIGRERNGNPAYARAYKGDFEEVKETTVTGIKWQISKKGLVKPVIQIEPTRLDGATVTNVTGNNAKFMFENKINIGTKMTVKRSGMVIPKVVDILKPVPLYVEEVEEVIGGEVKWNDNRVELVTVEETDEQKVMFLTSFFKILGVEEVSEGTCQMLFDAGFDTVKKILSASQLDFEGIDRFGSRKAEIVYDEIHKKMKNVPLAKIQHASGKFNNLGSKKLVLLEGLKNPTINDVCKIDGFSDTLADSYLNGLPKYQEFVDDLGDLIEIAKTEIKEASSNEMDGNVFVFTGVRRADLNAIIEDNGGKIASGVSAKVTHLVVKSKGSGSSKEKKAIELGKEIITVDELEIMLAKYM